MPSFDNAFIETSISTNRQTKQISQITLLMTSSERSSLFCSRSEITCRTVACAPSFVDFRFYDFDYYWILIDFKFTDVTFDQQLSQNFFDDIRYLELSNQIDKTNDVWKKRKNWIPLDNYHVEQFQCLSHPFCHI